MLLPIFYVDMAMKSLSFHLLEDIVRVIIQYRIQRVENSASIEYIA